MPYDNLDPEHFVDEGRSPLDEEPRTNADGGEPTEAFYPGWNGDPETAPDLPDRCEHSTSGNGFVFVCDLADGHKGWHQQTTQLRDSTSRTNWGDDGLSIHASKDEERRSA